MPRRPLRKSLPRSFRNRLPTRPRQLRRRPAPQQFVQAPVRINRRSTIRHQPSRIRRRPVITVQFPPQHPQHRHQLPAMMRGMRNPPHHHPCPRSPDVKKRSLALPPLIIPVPQDRQSFPAILRITLDKLHPRLRNRQRRRSHINAQHVAEPQILAHALMHHLLLHAAPPRIALARPHRQILIAKLAPNANHLHPLSRVRPHQKFVSHS